jgi:predicted transcriptional regulator of viral defense system
MSTGKNNVTAKRIALLSEKDEKLFHSRDLANLWLIENKNTLYATLKRYQQTGLLHRIYKGFYSLLPLEKLDPQLIGIKALHEYCYVSTESVLFAHGFISQMVEFTTLVSQKSLKFTIGPYHFISRKLDQKYLYNQEGITQTGSLNIATPERAIADMLYFNPTFHFDKTPDWQKVKKLQQKIGYPLTTHRYDRTKTG